MSAVDAFGGNIVGLSVVWFFIHVAERISTRELKVNVSFILLIFFLAVIGELVFYVTK